MIKQIKKIKWLIPGVISVAAMAGCQDETKPQQPAAIPAAYWRTGPEAAKSDQEALGMLATDVQVARDGLSESEALQRLNKWEAEHNMIYQIKAVRLDTGMAVATPSVHPYPIRVDVSVFRGAQPIYNFSFVPRDNRNVVLLGE